MEIVRAASSGYISAHSDIAVLVLGLMLLHHHHLSCFCNAITRETGQKNMHVGEVILSNMQ